MALALCRNAQDVFITMTDVQVPKIAWNPQRNLVGRPASQLLGKGLTCCTQTETDMKATGDINGHVMEHRSKYNEMSPKLF